MTVTVLRVTFKKEELGNASRDNGRDACRDKSGIRGWEGREIRGMRAWRAPKYKQARVPVPSPHNVRQLSDSAMTRLTRGDTTTATMTQEANVMNHSGEKAKWDGI